MLSTSGALSRNVCCIADRVPNVLPQGNCPICTAVDAYVAPLGEGDEYYVECLNCKVYRISRKTFRHFEYLRARGEANGLAKLKRLGTALNQRGRTGAARLEFDTWESFSGTSPA